MKNEKDLIKAEQDLLFKKEQIRQEQFTLRFLIISIVFLCLVFAGLVFYVIGGLK